jgi:hypothetical protein
MMLKPEVELTPAPLPFALAEGDPSWSRSPLEPGGKIFARLSLG